MAKRSPKDVNSSSCIFTRVNSSKITDFPYPVGKIAINLFHQGNRQLPVSVEPLKNDFQQFNLLRDDLVLIAMIRHYIARDTLLCYERNVWWVNIPFCQQSVIVHILTNQVLCCWAETLKRVCRRLFLVSPSYPLGHATVVRRLFLVSPSYSLDHSVWDWNCSLQWSLVRRTIIKKD